MFEKAAIFSAVVMFTGFSAATIKFSQMTEWEAASPVAVIKEVLFSLEQTKLITD